MALDFRSLWRGHPINHSERTPCIASHDLTNLEGMPIKAGMPVFDNQVAIRMGVALKRAGVQALELPGISHCSVHDRSEMHFINAAQLATGIARASIDGLGPVEKIVGADAAEYYPKLFGRTGIIYIQDYWSRVSDTTRPTGDAIDVWNGYRTSDKWLLQWLSGLGYYTNYSAASEIWFWEVK